MKAKSFLSAGALAIALATLAAPTLAAAEDRPQRENGEHRGNPHEYPGNRGGGQGSWSGRPAPQAPAPAARPPAARPDAEVRNFGDMRARMEQARRSQAERSPPQNGGPRTSVWGQPLRDNNRSSNSDENRSRGGAWNREGREAGRGGWNPADRNRDPRWTDQRRDNDRGGWRGDREGWRGDRDGWRDNRGDRDRDRDRTYRGNYRDWDRGSWRRNDRYDWRRYRDAHREVYSIGRYYAPYYGYSYRRIGIGITLGSLFYTNRYWIDDPWSYRLPEVYGPYRWVRYYDDVLLVNIYTGEVVDVIYDFFW